MLSSWSPSSYGRLWPLNSLLALPSGSDDVEMGHNHQDHIRLDHIRLPLDPSRWLGRGPASDSGSELEAECGQLEC